MAERKTVEMLWNDLSEESREFVKRVLGVEEEKLYLEKPRHVNEEILRELEDIVRDY